MDGNPIEAHALTPEAVEHVIQLTEMEDNRDRQKVLALERKDVAKRIKRIVALVESGSDSVSLVAKLRELEARRKAIETEVASLQPIPRIPKKIIEDRLAEWRRLLRQSTPPARAVLQRVLRGRITFTPTKSGGYTFEAPTRFDKLFSGIAAERPSLIREGDTTGRKASVRRIHTTWIMGFC